MNGASGGPPDGLLAQIRLPRSRPCQSACAAVIGRGGLGLLVLPLLLSVPAGAQPGPHALDEAIRLGTIATLAPLCSLRDEVWSFDLRRATILDAARAAGPEDEALRAAPDQALITGALSFAEAEALESFAEAPPERSCAPLRNNPELTEADAIVQAFRTLKARRPVM